MKIKELAIYIKDEMVDEMYRSREEKLHKKSERDKEELKWLTEEYPAEYETVVQAINALKTDEDTEKRKVINILDEFCMKQELYSDYGKEKFYKIGFCDGARTILEAINAT